MGYCPSALRQCMIGLGPTIRYSPFGLCADLDSRYLLHVGQWNVREKGATEVLADDESVREVGGRHDVGSWWTAGSRAFIAKLHRSNIVYRYAARMHSPYDGDVLHLYYDSAMHFSMGFS